MVGQAGPPSTRHPGSIGRNRIRRCFFPLVLISCLLSINCVALSSSVVWQDYRLRPDQQNQIWLRENDDQPAYKLLDERDRSYPSAETALEVELADLEALQFNPLSKSQLAYELDSVPQSRPVVENNLLPERIDSSDISLGRLITRPSLSAKSAHLRQPIEYPRLSESNQLGYTVEEPNELDGAKLAELLNTEKALVDSLAFLDSTNDNVIFDEDNTTYSDIKDTSFKTLLGEVDTSRSAGQQPSTVEEHNLEGDRSTDQTKPVRVNFQRVSSETKPTVISTTLLDDEDLNLSSNDTVDAEELTTPKTANRSVSTTESGLGVLNELTSILHQIYSRAAGYLPSLSEWYNSSDQTRTLKAKNISEQASDVSAKPRSSQTPAKLEVSEFSGQTSKRTHDKLDANSRDYTNNDKHSNLDDKQQYEKAKEPFLLEKSQKDTSSADDAEDLMADSTELLDKFATHQARPLVSLPNGAHPVASGSGSRMRDDSETKGRDDLRIQKVDGVTKYIYAPEHHIHLNSDRLSKKTSTSGDTLLDDDDDLEDLENFDPFQAKKVASLHREHTRHFKPGDIIYGSYLSSPGPHVLDHDSPLAQNKSNDLYFLVMVAAFCIMAMAVVLAAGLFAYRIQQNRATSADADYPTYGVVGPNNISSKCGGASSFAGGYFSSSHAQAQASSMGSSGSVKSAKLTINDSASAGATSDSGILSSSTGGPGGVKSMLGKRALSMADQMAANHGTAGNKATGNYLANQNAARMYHYQHQKQQMIIADHNSASGRHTSASDLDSEDENDDGSYTVYECPGLASAHEMEIKNPLFNDDRTP